MFYICIFIKRCEPMKTLQGCLPSFKMRNAKEKWKPDAKVYSFMVNPTLVSGTLLLSGLYILLA